MRKKAQERKKGMYQPSSSSSSSSSSESSSSSSSGAGAGGNISSMQTLGSVFTAENKDRSFYDTGGFDSDHFAAAAAVAGGKKNNRDVEEEEEDKKESGGVVKVYSQDEIWNDIELSEDDDVINQVPLCYDDVSVGNSESWPCQTLSCGGSCSSPVWDYCPVSLWMTGDDSFYNNQEDLMSLMNSSLVGKDFN